MLIKKARLTLILLGLTAAPVLACAGAMGRFADWNFVGNALLGSILPLIPVELFILKFGLKTSWIDVFHSYFGCLIAKVVGFVTVIGVMALFLFKLNIVGAEIAYSIGHWITATTVLLKLHTEPPPLFTDPQPSRVSHEQIITTAGLTSTIVPWLSSLILYLTVRFM